uniref:Ig-like domain-containing protein n=1 Tax=Dicentrarchus labrax TaxID=13489 RepID=A0A8P4G3Z3_DICLA
MFIRKLTNIQAIMGSVVTMECKVAGSLPMSVEWCKGKQKITKSSKYKLLHTDNTVSLEFKLTESADTGDYSCKVTNTAGSSVCSGVLTAKVPPRFVTEPESQAVIPKSTVLFTSIFEGTPPFVVKWFKDDIELITEPSCMIRLEKYSSSLELYSVGTLQFGIYSCQVSNEAGAMKSAAELTTVRFGQQLTLTATVKGSEPLTVSWVQDKDHILRDGDNRKITFENNVVTLVVPKADSTTAGKYTCQLRNDSGLVKSVSQVTVLGL